MNDPHLFRDCPDSPGLAGLRAVNPVPTDGGTPTLNPAELDRSEQALARILADSGDSSPSSSGRQPRHLQILIAAAAIVALVFAVIPLIRGEGTPTATAQEVLTAAGESAGARPELVDTFMMGKTYQYREDSDATGSVSRATKVGVGGDGVLEQKIDASDGRGVAGLSPELQKLAASVEDSEKPAKGDIAEKTEAKFAEASVESPNGRILASEISAPLSDLVNDKFSGDTVRGALTILTMPGLPTQMQKEAYTILADASGVELLDTAKGDEQPAKLAAGDLQFSVYPSTGQLVEVNGLIGSGVRTTIRAAGMVDCINVAGLDGPKLVSLACADDNYVLTDLKWENWTADTATARGTAWVNDCDPNCADGRVQPHPVRVRVSKMKDCGYHMRVYSRLEVIYPDGSEPPFTNETFPMECA